jgi:glycosidase
VTTIIEPHAPITLAEADLRPRGTVHPSPTDWRDQTLYFLLPDRFSDGGEAERPMFDYQRPDEHRIPDKGAWMAAGKSWQGGTLKGIQSKLPYLKTLGVTTLWIGPLWKQRTELDTYHGYAIQNFLDIDPRFGTRQDLRDLVDAAHEMGMYVLLDIIYNHTGNNWFYDNNGEPRTTMPYRAYAPYPVHSWRSGDGEPIERIIAPNDGVFPLEFQNFDWYNRKGQIGNWDAAGWENPLHPDVEFRRGDFFDLKDLNSEREDVLNALVKVYQYWIALSDCDGFRIDTVKHIGWETSRRFCAAVREYAEAIGKDNFFFLGEVTGGEYLAKSYLDIFGRNLDAILDIGAPKARLAGLVKGTLPAQWYFDQYTAHDLLGGHRETGRYHVSILDDHDMVGNPKRRFSAGNDSPAKYEQAAHAVAVMLLTLGIPCIYYGTEQALNGSQDSHDYTIEPHLSFEDRYIREAMFGAAFGSYETCDCHFFNPNHPTYLRIAALSRIRERQDFVGMALRRGRQYLREITSDPEKPFIQTKAGEIAAWSRIMLEQEVVVALNTHPVESRRAYINVDVTLNPAGKKLQVLYQSDWSDEELRSPPTSQTLAVTNIRGRSAICVELPPAGMMILA